MVDGPAPDPVRPEDPEREALRAKVRERRLAKGIPLEELPARDE